MASVLYPKAREAWGAGAIDWTSATLKCALVTIGSGHYEYSDEDEFYDVIDPGDVIALSDQLVSATTTDGWLKALGFIYASMGSGDIGGALVIIDDTGTPSTSRVLVYIDDYPGLPIETNGADVNVSFPPRGIARL